MAEPSELLEIAPAQVIQVIYLYRESGGAAEAELREFIDGLNDDEKAHLTAIAWIGRGSFEAEDFQTAVDTVFEEASTPAADYLLGMPHLAENLEAGLEALGIDVASEEEDFL